jgi:hypothetical protein
MTDNTASDYESSYKELTTRGVSAISSVMKVKSKKDGKIYAARKVDMNCMKKTDVNSRIADVEKMQKIPHPYIVNYVDCYQTKSQELIVI